MNYGVREMLKEVVVVYFNGLWNVFVEILRDGSRNTFFWIVTLQG